MSQVAQTSTDFWPYLGAVEGADETGYVTFGALIRAARQGRGWTQEDLAAEATAQLQRNATDDTDRESKKISLRTVVRWEQADGGRYEPDQVRAVFEVLGLDMREAIVALGFATREQLGLPPAPPRMFGATTEEVIRILEDPKVPEEQKREWLEYLRFRTQREQERRRPRRAG